MSSEARADDRDISCAIAGVRRTRGGRFRLVPSHRWSRVQHVAVVCLRSSPCRADSRQGRSTLG
jgi:hypothetical protein